MAYRKENYVDLDKLRITRTNYNNRYYKETAKYPRRPWSQEEMKLLFNSGLTDHELSIKLKRSMKAITIRRSLIRKKMEEGLQLMP